MKKRSVISWLEDAPAEEIGEALLAVGPQKAARVVAYLMSRFGPEMGPRIDRLVDDLARDPQRVVGGAITGAIRGIFGE